MDPAIQSEKITPLATDIVSRILPDETVLGVGNDIVEVPRIATLIDRSGGTFLGRSFTPSEIEECNAKARPAIHFAGKWAAKEAIYKALSLRWNRPFSWKEIEVLSPGDGSPGDGSPVVRLSEQIHEQIRGGHGPTHNRAHGREEERSQERKRDKRQAQQAEKKRGFEPPRLLLSISHTDEYAFAVALAVGRE